MREVDTAWQEWLTTNVGRGCTPESMVDKVAELQETIGLNYLMCAPLSRDTFRLLADKVVPRLIG